MQYSADTQPHSPRRRNGCLTKLFLVIFCLFMMPVFLCGLSLVTYLLFPQPHLDILVMGLDSRAGQGMVSRADSIMLVGIDPPLLRVSVLSIPRDMHIEVPNYDLQPINTINMLGEMEQPGSGPALLSASIAQNFGVRPERYVRLDFAGFVELVDAVGGLMIYVDRVIVDDAYPVAEGGVISVRFESGLQYMDGERALIYARTRHADDDYRRAERQQQVLAALAGRLANPLNWLRVWSVLAQRLDTDLTLWDMATIAPPVLLNVGRFEQLVINRDYIVGTAGGYAVPDYARLAPWLQGRFD
jgi:LCP family protein required for cell wall assembly